MDHRDKIATDNLDFCIDHRAHMSDWENGFITSLHDRYSADAGNITQKQFNKLHEIVQDIKKRMHSNY